MRVLGNIPRELNCLYSDSEGGGRAGGTEEKNGTGLGEDLLPILTFTQSLAPCPKAVNY